MTCITLAAGSYAGHPLRHARTSRSPHKLHRVLTRGNNTAFTFTVEEPLKNPLFNKLAALAAITLLLLFGLGLIEDVVRDLLVLHYDPTYASSMVRNFTQTNQATACVADNRHAESLRKVAQALCQSQGV